MQPKTITLRPIRHRKESPEGVKVLTSNKIFLKDDDNIRTTREIAKRHSRSMKHLQHYRLDEKTMILTRPGKDMEVVKSVWSDYKRAKIRKLRVTPQIPRA